MSTEPLDLGQFIKALSVVPRAKRSSVWVAFRWGNAHPGKLMSYRGFYERLALTFDGDSCFVDALLVECEAAIGATFHGYKGGQYRMDERSLLHVANWGDTSDTRIVGVTWEPDSCIARIETEEMPDAW